MKFSFILIFWNFKQLVNFKKNVWNCVKFTVLENKMGRADNRRKQVIMRQWYVPRVWLYMYVKHTNLQSSTCTVTSSK